jgi:MtN3 and saliva related transmembrane protein
MNAQALGYVGLVAFALAWLPQSWETVRAGECGANAAFLALSAIGSAALTAYAFSRRDWVFFTLNAMTTAGAVLNAWYRAFPRPVRR